MARNGVKTGGKDFGPDNPPPKSPGAPKLPEAVRDLRKLTVEEVELMISTLLTATESEIEAVKEDPATPVIKKIVCNVLGRTYETGSMGQFDMLLNRVIGKVKEKIEHEIIKPSILEKRDGTQIIFNMVQSKKDDDNG